ncbi:flagellar motor switch protein FliG [Arthrobacter glacialis]|uniref:Flagellar motor switch protein FliG n=1 Tax=Arthrobacter glacialis TaxID=1664 RepID=A0A2S3ZX40_ARTGL|nr:flagellar motor switch protein FliG [Arthrobacter glacialis]POH73845.1 flagellar motor switch protein FliG [Arthrobacter glacialis]
MAGTALTGTQKAAALLMQFSQAAAAAVMSHLSDAEAESIAAEIVKMRRVQPDIADAVIDEFHGMAVRGRHAAQGGRDFAAGLLAASFGSEKAAGVMDRLASTMAGRPFEFLDDAEPGQLLSLLEDELPATIALVMAHLRPDKASATLAGLPGDLRADVAQAIGTMGAATPEAVGIVAATMRQRALAVVAPREQMAVIGGVQPLVDIINRSDVATERALLEELALRDPELAEEVRSRMLTFADLVKLDNQDVQLVLRGLDANTLALAMKGAPTPVLDTIRANISERNRELLEFELEALGPVRTSEVEQARADIVRIIRELEAVGEITIRRGDDDDIVY